MCKYCHIIPSNVLEELAKDKRLSEEIREGLLDTAKVDLETRRVREQARKLAKATSTLPQVFAALAAAPQITVFDCQNKGILPGMPIANPPASADQSVNRAFDLTSEVADFFNTVFGRNSIDNGGMTIQSSVHYGTQYKNAFWNGFQMAYGDGDGALFLDFTGSDDVICHELTHGVTQFTMGLVYTNEPGGLNESMSDVFGSMFRQWRAQQTAAAADWLIGADLVGPALAARGVTCLRDMADPASTQRQCLSPQINHINAFRVGMGPHQSSGIPNRAFHAIATALGGNSWDRAGQIWYQAMTGFGRTPNLSMQKFAARTKTVAATLYPGDAAVAGALSNGWALVGL